MGWSEGQSEATCDRAASVDEAWEGGGSFWRATCSAPSIPLVKAQTTQK